MSITNVRSDRRFRLAELRRRIGAIERSAGGGRPARTSPGSGGEVLFRPFGVGPADEGLSEPCLHELVAAGYGDQPAVRDFGLALIASLIKHRGGLAGEPMVLWCQRTLDSTEFGRLYGPGLQALGLPPERFLMVTGKRDADCLWAMEQGLASRSLLAVFGTVGDVDLIASRRLSLAAGAHGTLCFLLPARHGREPSAARRRWRIRSAPSMPDHLDPKGLGKPAWHIGLERSPNGRTGHWTVEWDHAAHHFHLVAARGGGLGKVEGHRASSRKASDVVAFDRAG